MGALVNKHKILESFRFGIAVSPEQRRLALELRQALYIRKGIADDVYPARPYIPPQAFLPGSVMFIATYGEKVVGTLSLYVDSNLGLPMEDVHPLEVDQMRRRFPRLVEIGSLAIDDKVRSSRLIVVLFNAIYRWCRRCDYDAAVVCVHPSSNRVYRSLLRFEVLGPLGFHSQFKNAPSLPLGVDFRTAADSFRKRYNNDAARMEFFSFFTDEHFEIRIPEYWTADTMQWTMEEVAYLNSLLNTGLCRDVGDNLEKLKNNSLAGSLL